MKGAPERIVARCSHVAVYNQNGGVAGEEEMTEEWRERFRLANENLGGKGERVLGFAYLFLDEERFPEGFPFAVEDEKPNFPMDNLIFCGLISMIDPPRPTVPAVTHTKFNFKFPLKIYFLQAVRTCQEAGIRVVMVTGKRNFLFFFRASLNAFFFEYQETIQSLQKQLPSKWESSPWTPEKTLQRKRESPLMT